MLRSMFAFAGRAFFAGYIAFEPVRSLNCSPKTGSAEQDLDFGEVKGQQPVKRRRSRPGGHNILMCSR